MKTEKTDTKLFSFSVCVFLLLGVVRVLLDESYTLLQMSCVNLLALDYIFLHIFHGAYKETNKKVIKSSLPRLAKKRKNRKAVLIGTTLFLIILFIQAAYVLKWKSTLVNDIVSLVALFASIEDDHLANYVSKLLSFLIGI